MTYAYLASPYSHERNVVVQERYRLTLRATAWLLQRKVWVYSPIAHNHALTETVALPTDAAYWQRYNECMMGSAGELIVLGIPGWDESKGVAGEIAFARLHLMRSRFLHPREGGGWRLGPYGEVNNA